jgi:hypothetical protein
MFTYGINDNVRIKPLERPGVVRWLRFNGMEREYYVSWWDEGQRRQEWLSEGELE